MSGGDTNGSVAFCDCVNDLFLHQHVQGHTRYREGQSPSTLDLIFTNNEDIITDVDTCPPLGKSDHVVLHFRVDIHIDLQEAKGFQSRSYYHGDYDGMRKKLEAIDWEEKLGIIILPCFRFLTKVYFERHYGHDRRIFSENDL